MKKLLSSILAAAMVVSMAECGASSTDSGNASAGGSQASNDADATISGSDGYGVYAVPGYKDIATQNCWDVNVPLLEKYGYTVDGLVKFTSERDNYQPWTNGVGNVTILTPTVEQGADFWTNFKDYYGNAKEIPVFGYSYNCENTETEMGAVANVVAEYMLSMLYPFSTNYYRKFGYEVWSRGVRYELILPYFPAIPKVGHAMPVDADNRKECLADIQALTELWEMHYNRMAKLDQRAYGFVTEADPYRKQEFVYVYYDSVGILAGYMVFKKAVLTEGQRLVCSRFVFWDKTGLLGLPALAKSFAADYKSIVFVLPRLLSSLLVYRRYLWVWHFGSHDRIIGAV